MSGQEMLSPREKAVKALGAAMLAAIELTVREYMTPGQGEEFPLPAVEEQETVYRGAGENESFDFLRFQRLLQQSRNVTSAEEEKRHILPSSGTVGGGQGTPAEQAERETKAANGPGAEELSEYFERDARRYDGNFRVYE